MTAPSCSIHRTPLTLMFDHVGRQTGTFCPLCQPPIPTEVLVKGLHTAASADPVVGGTALKNVRWTILPAPTGEPSSDE